MADIEPIYCAEQIVIPPNLADILKGWTKEVVRMQPENLVEFAAIYFANLANVSKTRQEFEPPSVSQLLDIYVRVADNKMLPKEDLVGVCVGCGVDANILDKVFRTGGFTGDLISTVGFLTMLIASTASGLTDTLESVFEVFGEAGNLDTEKFLEILNTIAARDEDVPTDLSARLKVSLAGKKTITVVELFDDENMKQLAASLAE